MRRIAFWFLILTFFNIAPVFSQDVPPVANSSKRETNAFSEQFYLNPAQRVKQQTYVIDGFAFLETPDRERNTHYSIVTDFSKSMMKSQYVPGLQSVADVKKWLKDNVEATEYEGVEIRKLKLPYEKGERTLYWVGQKSFSDLEKAKQEITQLKTVVETQGGDLKQMIRSAQEMFQPPEEEKALEIQIQSNQKREEEIALKMLDKMEFGDKLFGPFEGTGTGEPIIWRSFGETTWRKTNLESGTYSAQVGYWTNQIIFQGFKFPLNTINPIIESTINLDATGADYKSNIINAVGLEWRPLARNAFLYNHRPWGIPLLQWIRNYRLYVAYGDRRNIKDEIDGSHEDDVQAGVDIFYEFGIELPPIDQAPPSTFADYLQDYVWGEYYGKYFWSKTGFSTEDNYNSWTSNSSIILGFKTPAIPLPANPLLDQLVLMPYMRFEHVNAAEFSFPYQNQYFVAAGLRWMPFRDYKFRENEWLAKIKVFGEYVGIGDVQHTKQDNGEAPHAQTHDLRFGVSFSSKRY